MRTLPSMCFVAAAVLAAPAAAQRLASYDPAVAGFVEYQPPTVLLPGPVPPVVGYPSVPALPPLPGPMLAMPGDSTFDNAVGLHWFTNGLLMASQPTPTFAPLGPIVPPLPIPAAVLAAIGGGPVTGIAINPIAAVGPVLFLCGAPGIVVGVAAIPAMPIVVPPFPLAFPTGPISGLEWDGATGSLLAVDVAGIVYNFLVGGLPLAPPIVPPMPLPAPAGDVAIDKMLLANVAGLRPIYVIAGPMMFDVNLPMPMPLPTGSPAAVGLAYLDHPAAFPPIGGCACPGFGTPLNFTANVMSSGNLAFALGVSGLAPFAPVMWMFDPVPLPAFPLINTVGCGLGLGLSGGFSWGIGFADPFGVATLAVPIAFPVGAGPLYNQNVALCPSDPTGLVLTPTQQLYAGGF